MYDPYDTVPQEDVEREDTRMVTPLDDATGGNHGRVETNGTLLSFEGYSSGQPFLLERPTRYIQRMRDAISSLIVLPEDQRGQDSMDRHILWSPIVTLPYPLLDDSTMGLSEQTNAYPLMHAPENYRLPTYASFEDWEEYAFTLTLLYTASDVMTEYGADVYTYGIDGQFMVNEDVLKNMHDIATQYKEPVRKLNLARLVDMTMQDPDHETDALDMLLSTWEVEPDLQHIVDQGRESAEMVELLYEIMFQDNPVRFTPFSEDMTATLND